MITDKLCTFIYFFFESNIIFVAEHAVNQVKISINVRKQSGHVNVNKLLHCSLDRLNVLFSFIQRNKF